MFGQDAFLELRRGSAMTSRAALSFAISRTRCT